MMKADHKTYHMFMVKQLHNLCCFKKVALKAAFCAHVVKILGECLCGGLFLKRLWDFSSASTFPGEWEPLRFFFGNVDCKCRTAILFST